MHTIELSDKELYLLWIIACWFNAPVTSTLKYKLAKIASDPKRYKFDKKYEKQIEDQLIKTGKFLDGYREREKAKQTTTIYETSNTI